MTEAWAWLETRLAGAPESLRLSVLRASAVRSDTTAAELGALLTAAAERLIAGGDGPGGADALTLLTADALITLACEWDADQVAWPAHGPLP